jgi:tRNA A-37 threonylcarbamoyl transferase component Bud32
MAMHGLCDPTEAGGMDPRSLPTEAARRNPGGALAPSWREARVASRVDTSPAILTDLMIAALLRPGGGVITLDPEDASAILTLRRGNATIAQVTTSGDVAAAAIGRLARMTGLDPLAERGSLTGPPAARLAVCVGGEAAEILVTLGATALGMSAELRLLSLHGTAVEHRPVAQLKRCVSCGACQPPLRQRCEVDGGALRELWDNPVPGGTIGAYVLGPLLGEGAMGEVFAAEHAFIERRVAIKVLRARMATDPTFDSRFLFEARATSRLRHPNVVEVTDYGLLASGSPFIVMERLFGESLERRIAGGQALEAGLALRIARACALGLSAAHEGGVIHNDLKPSNVILLRDSEGEAPGLKIVDFGAASLSGVKDDGVVVGTAAFMAPERICGEPSDVRSDVYSLGVMLHRMLSGALPFDAKDSSTMFQAHVNQAPTPLVSPFGVLPARVVRVVTRALQKKPSERYQTMKQMIVDIDQGIGSLSAVGWRKWLP